MLKMFRLVKKYWSKNKTGHLCRIFNMLKWPVSLRRAKSCSTGEMGPLEIQLKCPHSSAGPQSALSFWVYFKLQLLATVLKASSNKWRVLKCHMRGLLLIPTNFRYTNLLWPASRRMSSSAWGLPWGRILSKRHTDTKLKEEGKRKKAVNYLMWIPLLNRRPVRISDSLIA